MIETKWTPGPWKAWFVDENNIGVCSEKKLSDIAYICTTDTGRSESEEQSNTHLIAAAPDLAALLIDIRQHYELSHSMEAKIDAALAKARGEA